jgi:hypothetical protein
MIRISKSNTNGFVKTSLLAMGIALAIGAVALPAAARGTVATAGIALPESDAGCFSEFYGARLNVCGSTKLLRFSPSIDSSGSKDVWVFAEGAGPSNNVGCQALGIDSSVTWYWASPTNYLPAFGSTQTIYLSGAQAPGWGAFFVNCYVNSGGRVNSIHWIY